MKPWMKPRHWVVASGLFALVLFAAIGLIRTRDTDIESQTRSRRAPLVNQVPVQTARDMAALSAGRHEQRYAQQVLRLADHEVDLAFAEALREATEHPTAPTPQSKEIAKRVSTAENQLQTDHDQVARLKKGVAGASAAHKDALQQELDLAQAQLELDQDELDDARMDLIRSGADLRGRIQRQFDRYQASQHDLEAHPLIPNNNSEADYHATNLVGQIGAWRTLQAKRTKLVQARAEITQFGATLNDTHESLEGQIGQSQGQPVAAGGQTAANNPAPQSAAAAPSDTVAAIASLHKLSTTQKKLSNLDKRIQDYQELGDAYGNWIAVVESHQRTALHGMILSGLWIALILLGTFLVWRILDHFFSDLTPERTRLATVRVVVRFAVQALAVLLVLFVIFGAPNQLTTIIGLATAGLTVALKDFIISFIGWFVLMGRNGIRVGDWVEINGVVGEVAEITLLRTVLLETGNWTDTGHPTGRKVVFMNGYAIEGHFFNFSTAGQWLWDEIEILVPSGQDPYPVIDTIHKAVEAETASNAQIAEEEWRRATTYQRIQPVSAAAAINVRPTSSGVELHVRYITRAQDRYETRTRLYRTIVDILHRKQVAAASTEGTAAAK